MISQINQWSVLATQSDTAQIALTPNNRGLAYGDGFFTTMAVLDGAILWSDYHRQRLISHAHALQLIIDSHKLLIELQAQAQQLQQGILKLIITRAEQSMQGYGFRADSSGSACEIWLKVSPMLLDTSKHLSLRDGNSVFMQPATTVICLTSQIACLPPPLAGLKSLNRLDNVLASGELQAVKVTGSAQGGEDIGEGLLRDMTGHWVEGTMSNVFYQLSETGLASAAQTAPKTISNHPNDLEPSHYLTSGQWYTPSMDQSGVAGVMRQVLIDALAVTTNPVIIRPLMDTDLPQLSQLFCCNAVRGIMPVSELTLLGGDIVSLSV